MTNIAQLLTEHMAIWTAADTVKKSGRGRASGNAGSVYGVKKLRELIYELASTGKLIEGEPNCNLKLLGDVSDFVMGQAPPGAECNFQGLGEPFVKTGEFGETYPEIREWTTKPLKFAKQGDVLICVVGATIGKLNLGIDCSIGRSVAAIRPTKEIDTKYLYFMLMPFTIKLRGNSRGSAQGVIGKTELSAVKIRVPPKAEQHRIVAKVDELMALCDQLEQQHSNAQGAHETLVSQLLATLTQSQNSAEFNANWQRIYAHFDVLFTTEASIDNLKQTLLQLAVMGKLVPQDPNDEPASELLKRIQAEKAKLIAEGKLKKEKSLAQISEDEKPFYLPQGWEWVRLEQLSQVGTGATPLRSKPEYFSPAEVSWVTSGETSNSFIYETEQFVSERALKETNLTIYPIGTLVVAMYGQGKTRGQISELMIEACTNQACAAIQLFEKDSFHRKYLKLFFEKIYDEIRELSAGGAQPNLNLSKIKETSVPLPSINEQHRIVSKVDALMALCDQLKTRIQQANQQQQSIANALVTQAVN